jgi:NhaP-type Na+/H+ and K+/H+ antiporter
MSAPLPVHLALLFVVQMGLGAVSGLALGHAMVFALNRLKLAYEGIYPVFALAFAALIYGATTVIGGSGFLAVYVAGLVAGNSEFIQIRVRPACCASMRLLIANDDIPSNSPRWKVSTRSLSI